MWQDARMSQTFGMETPREHTRTLLRPPVRYLVLIDSGGYMIARLFLATRELVAEVDAGVEEVTVMTKSLVPEVGALGSEWDIALQGHSTDERATARVYTLDI